MALTRRDLCVLLPALLAASTTGAESKENRSRQLLPSTIYDFAKLHADNNNGESYVAIFEGDTHSGLHIKLHETGLAPGAVAHQPYHHAGDEMFMVRQGTLEVEIEGKRSELQPGSVAYIASNTVYAIRNTSREWTHYFVFLFGAPHPRLFWDSPHA
jgi:quercetin dioxygenase-like cupin family protein